MGSIRAPRVLADALVRQFGRCSKRGTIWFGCTCRNCSTRGASNCTRGRVRSPIDLHRSGGGDFQQLGIAERNLSEAKARPGPSDREHASQRQAEGGPFHLLHPFSKPHLYSPAFVEEPNNVNWRFLPSSYSYSALMATIKRLPAVEVEMQSRLSISASG